MWWRRSEKAEGAAARTALAGEGMRDPVPTLLLRPATTRSVAAARPNDAARPIANLVSSLSRYAATAGVLDSRGTSAETRVFVALL